MAAGKQVVSESVGTTPRKLMTAKTSKSNSTSVAVPSTEKSISLAEKVEELRSRGVGSIEIKTAKTIKELQIGRIFAKSGVSVDLR